MKERPILMNGAMVRATLSGRKTQTRRVVKPQPEVSEKGNLMGDWLRRPLDGLLCPKLQDIAIHCPYGLPGDCLWVRESFWGCDGAGWGDTPCVVYDDEWHGKHYQAAEIRPWAPKFGRIPSIHMPRACSRITLEVSGVRVERLQDLSEEDALAEGVEQDAQGFHIDGGRHFHAASARESYASLWDSLDPPTGSTWADNPWVWVVNFKRI